jgi:hypothetical protein
VLCFRYNLLALWPVGWRSTATKLPRAPSSLIVVLQHDCRSVTVHFYSKLYCAELAACSTLSLTKWEHECQILQSSSLFRLFPFVETHRSHGSLIVVVLSACNFSYSICSAPRSSHGIHKCNGLHGHSGPIQGASKIICDLGPGVKGFSGYVDVRETQQ